MPCIPCYPLLFPTCCFRQSFLLTMTHILTHIPGMSGCRRRESSFHCRVNGRKSFPNNLCILTSLLFCVLNQILINSHKSNNTLPTDFTSCIGAHRLAASPGCPHSEVEPPLISPASLWRLEVRLTRPPGPALAVTGPDQLKAALRLRTLAEDISCNGIL